MPRRRSFCEGELDDDVERKTKGVTGRWGQNEKNCVPLRQLGRAVREREKRGWAAREEGLGPVTVEGFSI